MTAATDAHFICFSRTLARYTASVVNRSVKAIFSRATSKTDEGENAICQKIGGKKPSIALLN
jgi:hypothetical protein